MSKNAKGLLGDQVGKVGPVVARIYRNENVYSAYQPKVKNPRTTKQQQQRSRFAVMSKLSHEMACGARFGFLNAVRGTNLSPRNLFQKLNFEFVTATGSGSVATDFTGFVVARGLLDMVTPDMPQFDTPEKVKVEFKDLGAPCHRTANDMVYVYIFCPDAEQGLLSEPVKVSAGEAVVPVPTSWNGLKAHVWMFTRNEGDPVPSLGIETGDCSDSVYCGSGTIS